jgi:hypothetical protein
MLLLLWCLCNILYLAVFNFVQFYYAFHQYKCYSTLPFVIDYDQYKTSENIQAADERNAKLFKVGALINISTVAMYGVFLIIFALPSPDDTKVISTLRIIVWSLQIFSFALLLFSTLKIRNLIMSNTAMARQVDTTGIRFTVGGAILMLIIYTTSYIVLMKIESTDPICLITTPTPDYLWIAIAYLCGFIAMLCEFFMIKRLGRTEEEKKPEREPTALVNDAQEEEALEDAWQVSVAHYKFLESKLAKKDVMNATDTLLGIRNT